MDLNLEDEWITVSHKNKIHTHYKQYNQYINYNNKKLEELIKLILDVLIKYNPYGIYIYGSRARKTNRSDSDIDLMIFWKKTLPDIQYLKNIKNELFNSIRINIDMVNMYITNKSNKVYDERDKCYYNNVINDAICIYQIKPYNLSDLINISFKLEKIN